MAGVERGSLIVVSVSGDHGKPRPAVVVQNDDLNSSDSVLVCLFSSDLEHANTARLVVEPTSENGLRQTSLLMTDKIYPIAVTKCGAPIGFLAASSMAEVDTRLVFVLGLGD